MVSLFPGLPRFCSSVCVQYNTQKRKNTKNREGLGTRLQIWLHTVSNMTLDVWLITVREKAWGISMMSCGQRVDIWGAAFDWYNSKTWHWSVPSVPNKKKRKAVLTLPCEWSSLQSLGSHFTRKVSRFDRWGTPPPPPPCTYPLFTYWKQFNTGSGQRLIWEVPGRGQEQRDRDRGTETGTGTGYRDMGTRLRLWSLPC